MRQFLLENGIETEVKLKRNAVFFPVEFELPEEIRDTMPMNETAQIEGRYVMRFYCDPKRGDTINWHGYKWRVEGLSHTPNRKGSRAQDECPIVMTEFLGEAEN